MLAPNAWAAVGRKVSVVTSMALGAVLTPWAKPHITPGANLRTEQLMGTERKTEKRRFS